MAKRFSLRQFFNNHPVLDRLRINTLALGAARGTQFWCGCFNASQLYSPGAQKALFGDNRKPVLYALYHGHMSATMFLPERHTITGLASASRDGEIIARSAELMGFTECARGSPAHGGVKGGVGMVHAAQKGNNLLFFVDGPRGPREEVKPGVVRLAQMAGTPIIPVVCQAKHFWSIPTWDLYHFPHWSSAYVALFGDPLAVPPEASDTEVENLRTHLEITMRNMTNTAKELAATLK